jgi:glycosyltransferase involved in cell wall biosynthesis
MKNTSIEKPLVSVLMTSYNREKYIAEAIQSVIDSTYEYFELIIVDDCSTDNTFKIAQSYITIDSRVKVFLNKKNLGDYHNRNMAASYAKGKYIKYLDADDVIYPNGLEIMVNHMEKFPSAALGVSFSRIDDIIPYPFLMNSADIFRNEFLKKSYLGVGPSATIISKKAFDELGGFSGKQYIGDTELWFNLAAIFPVVIMQPSLNWWRDHPDQQIKQEQKNLDIIIIRFQLRIDHLLKNKNHFSHEEYSFALNRIKHNFSRYILSLLIKSKNLKNFYYLFKKSGLNIFDLVKGFYPYV